LQKLFDEGWLACAMMREHEEFEVETDKAGKLR